MRRIIRCCNNVVIPHDITDFIYLMIAVMYLSAPAERNPHCAGGFEGDKFHLSVHESQIAQAVTMLSGALFSDNNPCDRWKITDISQAEPDSRVKRGAQITLYVRPVP